MPEETKGLVKTVHQVSPYSVLRDSHGSDLSETQARLAPYSGRVTRTQLLRGLAHKKRWGNVLEGRLRGKEPGAIW